MGNLLQAEESPQPAAADEQQRASRKSETADSQNKRNSPEDEQRIKALKEAQAAERKAEQEARRQRKEEKAREEREEEARCLSEAAFEALDVNESGFITAKEIDAWLCSEPYFKARNVGASPQALVDVLDKDKDGKVTQEEFVRVFSRLKDIEQMTSQLLLNANHWDADDNTADKPAGAPAPAAGGSTKPRTIGSPRAARKAAAAAGASSRALAASTANVAAPAATS